MPVLRRLEVCALLYGREVASCEDIEEGCLAACSVASASEYTLACSYPHLHYWCDLEHTITPTSSAPSSPLHTTASCQLFNHNHNLTSVPPNEALVRRLSSVKPADRTCCGCAQSNNVCLVTAHEGKKAKIAQRNAQRLSAVGERKTRRRMY